mgnify:CR=1 FL=1
MWKYLEKSGKQNIPFSYRIMQSVFLKERYRHQNRKYLIFLHCGHFYFIYFFAITGYESSQIFSKFEQQKLIRQGKRKHWWYLKFFQILKETAIYLVITYVTMGIYGICTDAKIGGLSRELQFQYNGLKLQEGFCDINCLSI